MGNGDPVENGTVRNPAHAEGNATGFANAFDSLGGKWLELLKEVAPNITRILYMAAGGANYLHSVETAAESLGLQVVTIPVSDVDGMITAIGAFAAEPNGGLLSTPSVFAIAGRELTRLAAQYRLPSVYGLPLPEGLMSYSPDLRELYRGVAIYVDRLLRGAKVSDLPVQYPTKFRLMINPQDREGARP